jgi:hypothetical protein
VFITLCVFLGVFSGELFLDSRQLRMDSGVLTPWSLAAFTGMLGAMKAKLKRKSLTFGDFITRVYKVSGKRKAKGIVQHAVNASVLRFLGTQRFVIS